METKNKIFFISIITIFIAFIAVSLYLCFGRTKTSFEVFFDSNGGTNVETQIIKRDELVKKPSNPIREGYIFIEWQQDNKTFDFSTTIKEDVKVIAKWQKVNSDIDNYIIQFDTDGGTTIPNQVLEKNQNVVKPKDPVKTGYTFIGWFVGGKEFDFKEEIIENKTIIAKWEQPKVYVVKFNSNSGTTVKSQNVMSGKKAIKPTEPTKNGYKFSMWKLNDKEYKFDEEVTEDITLTAIWIKVYTISFNTDGGNNISNQVIKSGEKAKQPTNPTKTGYIFDTWKLDDSPYNFDTIISKDINLIASWNKACIVTFDTKGGSNIGKKTIACNQKLEKPNSPTKSGYVFKEWILNGNAFDFNTQINDNITLEAVWEEEANIVYTVTFNSNGGSPVASIDVNEGDVVEEPAHPTKNGCNFNGWKLNGVTYNFSSKVTSNITLIADWISASTNTN